MEAILLPQKDWLTIGELENRWGISRIDVLHYLETGKLSAWLKLKRGIDLYHLPSYPDTNRVGRVKTRTDKLYLAKILNFKEMEWQRLTPEYVEYCECGSVFFSDLLESGIVLEIEGKAFCFKESSHINQDDLLIMMEDVKKFEARTPKIIGKRRLPLVGNREVVPVRLIPLITGGPLGREVVAGILSNRLRIDGFPHNTACAPKHRDNGIMAYYLGDQGEPVRMRSAEWGDVYDDIAVTEKLLRKREEVNGVEDSMYCAWRLETIRKLLPGTFLWRNDFEALWKACIACALPYEREPEDYRVINYDVYLPPKYRHLVFEGFEHLLERFENLIQPEESASLNVSDPEPSPSLPPNESPAPFSDGKEEQSAVGDKLPSLEEINRMSQKEKAAFWRHYAEQNPNKERCEIAYELAGMGAAHTFIQYLPVKFLHDVSSVSTV